MPVSKPLPHGETTLSKALLEERNILTDLHIPEKSRHFFEQLARSGGRIRRVVSRILDIDRARCIVSTKQRQWSHGSFNLCIPIQVINPEGMNDSLLMFRVPLPYKIGEHFRPGNVDEKIRSEAGTYVWMDEHCPEVPLAKLWAFGLTNGDVFSTSATRTLRRKASVFKKFRINTATKHASRTYTKVNDEDAKYIGTGFMLLDFVRQDGIEELGRTWPDQFQNQTKRTTFFRDLSKIMLSMARIPHAEIASAYFNDDCSVTFTSRPMSVELSRFENESVSLPIAPSSTYNHCSAYLSDVLRCHDNWLIHGTNSANDQRDLQYQASIITRLRAIQPDFIPDDSLRGPFYLTLTDLHSANIFVDEDWHIRYVIDLEWAGTRPLEMIHPPNWMFGMADDMINASELPVLQAEFVDILQAEEELLRSSSDASARPFPITSLARTMRTGLEKGAFWYFFALESQNLSSFVWQRHLKHRYVNPIVDETGEKVTAESNQTAVPITNIAKGDDGQTLEDITDPLGRRPLTESMLAASKLWRQDLATIIERKLEERERYTQELRRFFASDSTTS